MPCQPRTKKRPNKLWETDAHQYTRKRLESTLPKDHEDHIAEKGFNSLSHCNLVHKFVLMPQTMTIPECESSSEKLEKLPARQLTRVNCKKEVILEAQKEKRTVHLAKLMDICHLKKCGSWNRGIKHTKAGSCSEVRVPCGRNG